MTQQERLEIASALLRQTLGLIRAGIGVAACLKEDFPRRTMLWPEGIEYSASYQDAFVTYDEAEVHRRLAAIEAIISDLKSHTL